MIGSNEYIDSIIDLLSLFYNQLSQNDPRWNFV
ncbi:hypothetical protein J2S08_001344 [Bacillus chungangensis]|uniref:Uncharacterized protein n=1 Tax=Bacillus chungangensis TaxID=587633 RepID=A0ABT9WQF6_9BACI|nr:hypothetical protein [Bacillus chungangensis]